MDFVNAVILGIVEGVTEFLPISSTGHLILVEDYLPLGGTKAFADAFMVIIQLPAILAVVLYFWGRLWPFGKDKKPVPTIRLWFLIVAAFLPAAVLGFVLDNKIEELLFGPWPIIAAWAAGTLGQVVPAAADAIHAAGGVHVAGGLIAGGAPFEGCVLLAALGRFSDAAAGALDGVAADDVHVGGVARLGQLPVVAVHALGPVQGVPDLCVRVRVCVCVCVRACVRVCVS